MKNIIIPPSASGTRLTDWLALHGQGISADCGGRGTCGKCRVKVVQGEFLRFGSGNEILEPDGNGMILACRAVCPAGGAVILLPDTESEGLTSHAFSEMSGSGAQVAVGVQDLSEREKQPAVELHGLSASEKQAAEPDGSPSLNVVWESATPVISRGYGMALDIGTTTIAASLVDRASGKVVDSYSCLNPQRSYGADVISRITACREGRLDGLCRLIRQKTAEIISIFSDKHPDKYPQTLAVAGNTTMLHILCGISPEPIGVWPFTPAFTKSLEFTGADLGLPVGRVIVLPSASAYIGADITGGIFICGMLNLDEPSLLVDIGTNGETVLFTGRSREGRLIAASSAAGPALEGANISCGVGGIPGAVSSVADIGWGRLGFSTIADRPPVGICGSGLIGLVAVLLDAGRIDGSGYMDEGDFPLCGSPGASAVHIGSDGQTLRPGSFIPQIALTQLDVREFQLAKGAIRAGIDALLSFTGLEIGEIGQVFVAGGLGYYMSIPAAIRTGLLPDASPSNFRSVGNSSLAGAEAVLCKEDVLEEISDIAARAEVVDLNTLPVFSDLFMRNMAFPEKNAE